MIQICVPSLQFAFERELDRDKKNSGSLTIFSDGEQDFVNINQIVDTTVLHLLQKIHSSSGTNVKIKHKRALRKFVHRDLTGDARSI